MDIESFFSNSFKEYHWSDLYYYQSDFDLVFLAEEKIIQNSEKYIHSLRDELKQKIDRDEYLGQLSPNQKEGDYAAQYYEHYYGDFESLIEQIQSNQRKAFVLSIFSYIEGHLLTLCDIIQDRFQFEKTPKDLKGSDDIGRCINYLTKVYGVNYSKIEPKYTFIKQQKFVRNKIAHNDSLLDEGNKQLIKQTEGLELRRFGEKCKILITSDHYLTRLLEKRKEFFRTLVELIDERCGELK